jgi:hypothetical protein
VTITQISPATTHRATPNWPSSPGSLVPVRHDPVDTHDADAHGDPFLADPLLAIAADVVDDTERTKIANQNRLRQLTRSVSDSDGETRGFGLDESHPDVARLAALVEMLEKVEHQAVLNLQRAMRNHPLGPWVKTQHGIGEKQFARLLAKIGDPYFNTLHDRPRTVSELWAYCGLHTIDVPVSQSFRDTQTQSAGGDLDTAGGDQKTLDTHSSSVAARRIKGQKANWSTEAKSRAYLISEKMLQCGNRDIYDQRKAATENRTHHTPCTRCGPSGHPAQAGTPWNPGHRHADALRIQAKEMLKNLWVEARRLHNLPR